MADFTYCVKLNEGEVCNVFRSIRGTLSPTPKCVRNEHEALYGWGPRAHLRAPARGPAAELPEALEIWTF